MSDKCERCGRPCLPTRNAEEDVFVIIGDELLCARCYQLEEWVSKFDELKGASDENR